MASLPRLTAITLALALAAGAAPLRLRTRWVAGGGETLTLGEEDYVAAVLAGECASFRSRAALEAMAATARTFARAHRGRHAAESFDFCDTTHCQDVLLSGVTETLRAAAAANEGEVLWYRGAPARVFHHRHCGGRTAAAAEIWPGAGQPYLPSLNDAFCTRIDAAWRNTLKLSETGDVTVLSRTASGRVAHVRVAGRIMTGDAFSIVIGRRYGWNIVRSLQFDAHSDSGRVVIEGRGYGHGAGLCQTGAEARGQAGQTAAEILAAYFPGTRLGLNAQGIRWQTRGGERVDLWSVSPQDDWLLSAAERALAEAERRSGLRYSGRPRLRLYPTVAIYRDSTGAPGSVAASTRGATIRLQPVTPARAPALLLHEFLHVVLAAQTRPDTPRWLSEGLALYLAGDRPRAGDYALWRDRVAAHIARYGQPAVLGWLRAGVPREAR